MLEESLHFDGGEDSWVSHDAFRDCMSGLKNSLADEAAFVVAAQGNLGNILLQKREGSREEWRTIILRMQSLTHTNITNRLTIIARGEKALDDENNDGRNDNMEKNN